MARRKANDESIKLFFMVAGVLLFLPFMFVSFFHYKKLKKIYFSTSNAQRVFDSAQLIKSIVYSVGLITTTLIIMFYATSQLSGLVGPDYQKVILGLDAILLALGIYPVCKLAQRVAVRYLGVIFNDDSNRMIIPVDLANASASENLRLQFLKQMGECEEIPIKEITNITREKGVNFYIHGAFGSRQINFTNKQKRDECLMALQARTKVSRGGDLGY
ncbi:hypothetical protein [Shewanella glacialipiscicola]|uniref:Uncharacterized protein n=1 Tax=Shewanella glacialipiscicola TaxID=614069 RepID=A0ABQ6J5I4_9GAMM|nr:hypothetical protein [Shewanella glacialipiscicola]MCL1087685.1 hypothetical protein [Shewanella glacialipiscicola]GIU12778.1 hypothetical protein TUM4636_23010 [Shewanella glacialipiscicola]GMA82105.1 hypothetical protein GCM10025855_16380 [Shewanella glacialipiscicola]